MLQDPYKLKTLNGSLKSWILVIPNPPQFFDFVNFSWVKYFVEVVSDNQGTGYFIIQRNFNMTVVSIVKRKGSSNYKSL